MPDKPDGELPHVVAAATGEGTLSATVSIVPPPRTWEQRWLELLQRLKQTEDIYSGGRLDQMQLKTIVGFFKDCRELADWIENSNAAPGAIHYAKNKSALKICDAVAQPDKHYIRTHGADPMTAHVQPPKGKPTGVTAAVTWSTKSGLSGAEDALDLARRCVAEWRQFFTSSGLTPPA